MTWDYNTNSTGSRLGVIMGDMDDNSWQFSNYSIQNETMIPDVGVAVCFRGVHPAAIYMKVLTPRHMVMLAIASLLTVVMVALFVDAFIFLNAQVHLKRRKSRIIWVLGIYPVFAVTSLIALCIPRSSVLTGLAASMYLSVALYQFMLLIFDYFGGFSAMVVMLKGQKMSIGTPPILIFCCCCLPRVNITRVSLRWVRRLVLQVAVLRPIALFISAVMWADGSALYIPGKFTPRGAFLYLQVLNVVSTLTAFQAIVILFKLTKDPLKNYRIVPKFFSIQLALVFSNIQSVIIGLLIAKGKIPCTSTWSAGMEGMFLHNFSLVIEMFLFSLLARVSYRQRDGNLDYVSPPRPSFFRPRSYISSKWNERNGDLDTYLQEKGVFKEIEELNNGYSLYKKPAKSIENGHVIKYSAMDDDQPTTDV